MINIRNFRFFNLFGYVKNFLLLILNHSSWVKSENIRFVRGCSEFWKRHIAWKVKWKLVTSTKENAAFESWNLNWYTLKMEICNKPEIFEKNSCQEINTWKLDTLLFSTSTSFDRKKLIILLVFFNIFWADGGSFVPWIRNFFLQRSLTENFFSGAHLEGQTLCLKIHQHYGKIFTSCQDIRVKKIYFEDHGTTGCCPLTFQV